MKELTIQELNELFIDTLKKAYVSLREEAEDLINYNIFEEFDLGVHSFLHHDCLLALLNAQRIDLEIFQLSEALRVQVLHLQATNQWTLEAFKSTEAWREVLLLSEKTLALKINFDNQH